MSDIDKILNDLLSHYALQKDYDFYYLKDDNFEENVGEKHKKYLGTAKQAIKQLIEENTRSSYRLGVVDGWEQSAEGYNNEHPGDIDILGTLKKLENK